MKEQLGWACKLGGVEPLWITKVGHTVLARLMESQIWHQPGSVGGGSAHGQWLLLALMPDSSVSLCTLLVPFKLPSWRWSSEGGSPSR